MKPTITQQDSMGCGAACVAFAANKTYTQAVTILGENKARTVGFQLRELVGALSYYGLSYHYKHIKATDRGGVYPDGTIVFIKRSQRYKYGHYLIRHDGLWADPWINLVLDKNIVNAQSGYRKRLPGIVQWACYPL